MPDISEYTPYNGTNLCSDIDVVINQVRQALTDEAGTVFATLKARLDLTEGKAVSGAFNLTGSNVAEVCSNDADNLPNNRIYGVSIPSSTTVSHFPAKNGQMITFGTGATRSASGDFQVFFENNGTIHYRSIWNGTWSSWKTVADGGKAVSGAFNLTGSNVAEICNSDADNLPNNRIYGVSISSSTTVTNFPLRELQDLLVAIVRYSLRMLEKYSIDLYGTIHGLNGSVLTILMRLAVLETLPGLMSQKFATAMLTIFLTTVFMVLVSHLR